MATLYTQFGMVKALRQVGYITEQVPEGVWLETKHKHSLSRTRNAHPAQPRQ